MKIPRKMWSGRLTLESMEKLLELADKWQMSQSDVLIKLITEAKAD